MNTNIREWYKEVNPDDVMTNELGLIREDVTFNDIYKALKEKRDIYKTLGCESSTVRQYVFYELAEKLNCSYEDIYNAYLQKDSVIQSNDSQKVFLVSVPIQGTISLKIDGMNFDDATDYILNSIEGADYGSLKDINDGIDKSTDISAKNCIEDILLLSDYNDNSPFEYHNPIEGNLYVSVNAKNAEDAVQYIKDNCSDIDNQIKNDISIIGDLENPKINKEDICLYKSEKNTERHKIGSLNRDNDYLK